VYADAPLARSADPEISVQEMPLSDNTAASDVVVKTANTELITAELRSDTEALAVPSEVGNAGTTAEGNVAEHNADVINREYLPIVTCEHIEDIS
jgi:hypothetical protein